ncbi:hypothetical protein MPER_02053, partial [Moniliophthora perniciosa FA553]
LPASPPQYTPEMLSAFESLADIINPTTVDSDVAASTLNHTMSSASASTSRKRGRKDSDSGVETPHSPTPELSSDSSGDDDNDDDITNGLCGIKLTKGRKIGPYLAAELKKMSEKERTMKMLVYSKCTQKELDKADVEAKHRLVDMWLGDGATESGVDDEGQVEEQS